MTTPPPPGWYADPQAPDSHVRWWDGGRWTEHVQVVSTERFTEDGEPLAGWWQRVGQYVIDSLVIDVLILLVALPFLIHEAPRIGADLDRLSRESLRTGTPASASQLLDVLEPTILVVSLISTVVFCLYVATCLRWKGRTAGMAAVGIAVRTVESGGGRLPWGAILRRLVVQQVGALAYVPALALGSGVSVVVLGDLAGLFYLLDVLWPLWDRRRQTLHDRVAGTVVVRR